MKKFCLMSIFAAAIIMFIGVESSALTIKGQAFLDILKGHKVTIISGHNHLNKNFRYTPDVVEHNVAAICGTWWDAYHCKDGTPRGYKVYTDKEGSLSWYYKSVGKDKDFQYELNHLHRAEVEATFARKGRAAPSEGAVKITIVIKNPFGKQWVEEISL